MNSFYFIWKTTSICSGVLYLTSYIYNEKYLVTIEYPKG